jgi:hypothetical protein
LNIHFTTKPYLPTLVVSVILFITVFLPWATVSALGISISANGTHDWGVLTLIMSIIGAGLSFVAAQKMIAIGSVGAGILALIGVIIYWSRLSVASAGYGLIIALIASLALMYIGYWDYRKLSQPAKPAQTSQPPQSNPPAPPPPQQ